MDKIKYLPIELIRLSGHEYDSTPFGVSINTEPYEAMSYDTIDKAQRKLLLQVQRYYRKMVRNSGKCYEDFLLGIVTDITVIQNSPYDIHLFGEFALLEKEKFTQK
jgi:hypothetical protein